MIKRTKMGPKKWLKSIKEDILPTFSKSQPYKPMLIPWALKNYKKFLMKSDHPSFKTQGGIKFFLLDRAKKAYGTGKYEQEWLNDSQES